MNACKRIGFAATAILIAASLALPPQRLPAGGTTTAITIMPSDRTAGR